MNEAGQRVREVLDRHGLSGRIRPLAQSTHTAQQAADVLGVTVSQIAKSIVFRAMPSDRAVVVVTCGDRRVQEE